MLLRLPAFAAMATGALAHHISGVEHQDYARSAGLPSRCSLPQWTVQNFSIAYSDDTYTPGNSTFTLTDAVANRTETLKIPVVFNVNGHLDSTPGNPDLRVIVSLTIETAEIELNQTLTCAGDATK